MEPILIRYCGMCIDYFSALILGLILVSCILEKRKTVLLKIYICMAASCMGALILEGSSYLASFFPLPGVNILRIVLSTGAVICGYILSFFYACYVTTLISSGHRLSHVTIKVLAAVGVASACAMAVGSCFELYFTFQNQLFVPGRFFVMLFTFDIIGCLVGIVLIIKNRKILSRKDILVLLSFPLLIFISAVLQYTGYGVMFGLFLMAAVAIVIIYLMIQTDRNKRNVEQEKQLVEMNIAMMLSQIQPHFLYNALSSIRRMIKKDPEVAETAIENFSLYLRNNLESMSRVEPIPFAKELRHVEEYLYLEKLRFGDRLCVEYDIAYTDFTVPVLTLQPVVENAVKHGILKREDGGCVKISTRRRGDTVILTVRDNGVGFVPDAAGLSDRLQIGLKNVENRIRMQSRGTLQTESAVDVGTTVTITLPLV